MTSIRSGLVVAAVLVLSAVGWAHGGGPHIMGTAKSVSEKSIVVTDGAGKDVTVAVDDKTMVEGNGKAAKLADVKAGERVVVHTRNTDAGLVAVMIKFGAAGGASGHHEGEHEHHEGEHEHEHPAK